MYDLFCRTIVSTAFIECTFAGLRRWCIKAGTSIGNDSVAARHTLQCFVRAMESMNGKFKCGGAVSGKRNSRPPWVSKKARSMAGYGKSVSGRDVFYSTVMKQGVTFKDAAVQWKALSIEEKKEHERTAKGRRAVFKEVLDPLKRRQPTWTISSRGLWGTFALLGISAVANGR